MDDVLRLISDYGVAAVAVIITLEYACFPLPSEIVLPVSGAIAAHGEVNFFVILAISVACGLLGSMICYLIGRYGGQPLIKKLFRNTPKIRHGLAETEKRFNKYARLSVAICRIIPLCRTYISLVAGLACQPIPAFLGASAIGIVVWNTLLVGLGFLLGDNWTLVAHYYDQYKVPFFVAAGVILAGIICFKFRRSIFKKHYASKEKKKNEHNV